MAVEVYLENGSREILIFRSTDGLQWGHKRYLHEIKFSRVVDPVPPGSSQNQTINSETRLRLVSNELRRIKLEQLLA